MLENVIVVFAEFLLVNFVFKMYQALTLNDVVCLCVIEQGIALSIQPWHGEKQPSIWEFAALTIASHLSVVMSPCQR